MKRVISAILLLTNVNTVTLFFEVGTGSPEMVSMSIAGPNQEYVVQGHSTGYSTYTIDWQNTPHATSVKAINLNANVNIVESSRVQCDSGENCVVCTNTIIRFNIKPGAALDFEEYSVPTGFRYGYPSVLVGTSYILTNSRDTSVASSKKAYRIFSDKVTDVKTFNTGANSRGFGILYGTGWFLITLDGTTQRKLFDYTNGYEEGTNSTVQTHTKQDNLEIGFFSVEDGRELYVVSSFDLQRIYTVQYDGTNWLHQDVPTFVGALHPPVWIRDSDLCLVSTWAEKFFIVNFVDKNKPSPTSYNLPTGGKLTYRPGVWTDYKTFILPSAENHRSYVYKALTETPCADLCATCDGIYRKKCLTCDPGSSKTGDVCNCDDGFYEKSKSPTKKECLGCSPFCGTCSAGATTDCSTCKYSYMEKKGDGSCGCKSGAYLSGVACPQCNSSCLTCSGAGPGSCLSCDISRGRYLSGTTCPVCDSTCKTCSGGGSTSCLSCEITSGRYLSGTTCALCHPECKTCSGGNENQCLSCEVSSGRYLLGESCPQCHSDCSTCSGGSSSDCLSCSDPGYFLKSDGSCSSCAAEDSSQCPTSTKITVPSTIEEKTQRITLIFSPSLTSSLPSDFELTAEILLDKYLTLKFKRKAESTSTALTIQKKTLTHETASTTLIIEFLEKMRSSDTEHISLEVKDPWLYKPAPTGQGNGMVVYFKQQRLLMTITEIQEIGEQKDQRQAAQVAQASTAAIGASATAASTTAAFSGSSSFFAYLAKFFSSMDILSNLASINVEFGSRFKLIMSFIENLKIPEFEFVAKLSPIKDSGVDDPDVDSFRLKPRGTRGKMTKENEQVFIMSGQNFVVGLSLIVFWSVLQLLGMCLNKSGKVIGVLAFTYQILIGMVFYDFQMICSTEVAFFNYSRIRQESAKYLFSLMLSVFILVLIIRDFFQAYSVIRRRLLKKDIKLFTNERMVLERYTEGVNMNYTGIHNYIILIGNMRFFLIQIIISSLQLLNRTQALLVMIINLCFFVFFINVVCSSLALSSTLMLAKECIKEGCIMVVLLTITLFSFTEKSGFSSSVYYQVIEILAVVSMIGAAGSEFIILCSSIIGSLTTLCLRQKSISKVEQAKTQNDKNKILQPRTRESEKIKVQKVENKHGPETEGQSNDSKRVIVRRKKFMDTKRKKSRAMKSLAAKRKGALCREKSSGLEGWNLE